MNVTEAKNDAKLPPGQYKEGDCVRLRRPAISAGSFNNPRAPLLIARVLYHRLFSPPTYALVAEDGGAAVGPFTDGDLRPARRSRAA
jgi:hypothetical protein